MMAEKPKSRKKLSDYNRFIKKELKGKTGPGYKARFKAAVAKWKRSPKGRASRAGKPPKRQRRLSGGPPKRRMLRKRASPTRAKPKSTGGRKMAGFNPQKLMKYIRLAALVAPGARAAIGPGDNVTKLNNAIAAYTGYSIQNGSFAFGRLSEGWGPYLAAVLATYGVPKIAGIIRGL